MINVFQRSEKKYLVEKQKLYGFLEEIKDKIIPDRYGEYKICNVYFDTADDFLVRASNEKPVYNFINEARHFLLSANSFRGKLNIPLRRKI